MKQENSYIIGVKLINLGVKCYMCDDVDIAYDKSSLSYCIPKDITS